MYVLSLFDGMSCGQLALNQTGIDYSGYFASEIDSYAIETTMKNYPSTIRIGDVTQVTPLMLPQIDLLLGGSPCQGFSFAGNQLNFEDPRSKLFFNYVMLKNQLQPKYWLLENVRMRKEYEDIISMLLGVEPILIDSALFSAQTRRRLYWTNIPIPELPVAECSMTMRDIYNGDGEDITKRFIAKKLGTLARTKANANLRTLDMKARTLTAGGQSISNSGATNVLLDDGRIYKLSPIECERLQTVPDNYTEGVSKAQRYKMLGNGWTVRVIAHILKGMKCSQ